MQAILPISNNGKIPYSCRITPNFTEKQPAFSFSGASCHIFIDKTKQRKPAGTPSSNNQQQNSIIARRYHYFQGNRTRPLFTARQAPRSRRQL